MTTRPSTTPGRTVPLIALQWLVNYNNNTEAITSIFVTY